MILFDALHTRAYDLIVKNELFNKIIWQNDIKNYKNFVTKLIEQQPAGSIIVDIPCGPLSFTADIYAKDKEHQIYLLDLSPSALKIAARRLSKLNAKENIIVYQADALDLPFENQSIDLLLSLGFLHIFKNSLYIDKILSEFYRILKPKAFIGFQILAKSNSASDIFLKILNLIGQIGPPRKPEFYTYIIQKNKFKITQSYQIGTMLFIIAKKI